MKNMRKILLWTLGAVAVAAAGIGVGMAFFGLRFQTDGTGMRPMPYVDRSAERMAEIEKRSAEDRKVAPVQEAAEPATVAAAAPDMSAPWPAFYGAGRDGEYRQGAILTAWPANGLHEIWRRPVGGGYASMSVAQGRIYTIEQRRDEEVASAYALATGREVWTSRWKAHFQESMGGDGPRATPTWDDGRVYVLGAAGEFRCLDAATGAVIWRKDILEDNGAQNLQWGMAASPLVVDNLVIVMPGGGAGKSVVAYDKKSGARVWGALDDQSAYTAPVLATLAGKRQIVAVTATRAVGLGVDDGKLLWEFPWRTEYDINSALPVVVDDAHLILTAGYGHGAALVEIGGGGAREVWKSQAMKSKFNNVALYRGVVYGLDEGILAAMDAATGQRKWKGGRYGYGQLLRAGDHLVVLTETGEIALVKASPERHEEVAKFQAIEGKTWNVPAMADGRLIVRNTTEMACYQIGR